MTVIVFMMLTLLAGNKGKEGELCCQADFPERHRLRWRRLPDGDPTGDLRSATAAGEILGLGVRRGPIGAARLAACGRAAKRERGIGAGALCRSAGRWCPAGPQRADRRGRDDRRRGARHRAAAERNRATTGCNRVLVCAVRSYLQTADKHGLPRLAVLTQLFQGNAWIPPPAGSGAGP